MSTDSLDPSAVLRTCVAPFHEAMARTKAIEADTEVIEGVRSCVGRVPAREIARLLASPWKVRVMGAWYAAALPRPDLGQAVLHAIESSEGEGDGPPLLTALLDHVDMDAVPVEETADVLDDYYHRDLDGGWGAAGLTLAAAEVFARRTNTPNQLPAPEQADVDTLAAMRAVSRRLRP